ncbi:autotransporter assembly complex family protein [Halorhodospira neutriphila]|uniref:autotransporter assembly complex protein TamA n=1 Tax=Halorhodospira neutriphila TaxID=168379 RepID=UPI003083F425
MKPSASLVLALAAACAAAGVPRGAAAEVAIAVKGVEKELAEQVRVYLGEPGSEEPAAVAAFQRHAPERAREALEALGYYRAQVAAKRRRTDDGWRVVVRVDPGEPVRVRRMAVCLSGEAAADAAFANLESRLPLKEGKILHHGRYETSRQLIQNLALDRGYFDGRFTARRIAVDPEAGTAEVRLCYDSGVRYHFGPVRFADSPLAESFLERLVPFERGEPYTAEQVAALNRALLDSGYFSDVRVRPARGAASGGVVPIDVELTARARHELTTGVGYTTDLGARVRLGWRRPWVNRRGHAFALDTEIAERRQNLTASYTVPLRDPLRSSLEYQLGVQALDVADIDTEQISAAVQYRHRLDSGWQQTLFVRADEERFRIQDDWRSTTLFIPGASWSRVRSRGGLDPHWGDRQTLSVEATDPWLGSDIELRRVRAATRWVRTLGDRHRFRARAELGALDTGPDAFDDVPPSLRFYAGGDQSVRGYKFQSLGPKRDGAVIGGRYLAEASLEYGYQLTPKWRPAVFVDAGNAYADWDDLSGEAKVGAGLGVRYSSPIGPIRLDLAATVGEPERSWRLHFSMGSDL